MDGNVRGYAANGGDLCRPQYTLAGVRLALCHVRGKVELQRVAPIQPPSLGLFAKKSIPRKHPRQRCARFAIRYRSGLCQLHDWKRGCPWWKR